jgi:hypothetical protein
LGKIGLLRVERLYFQQLVKLDNFLLMFLEFLGNLLLRLRLRRTIPLLHRRL